MKIFAHKNALIIKKAGETVRVEPWGKDALRVRATVLSHFTGNDHALDAPELFDAKIEIGEGTAKIENGNIACVIGKAGNLTFFDGDRQVLAERTRKHMADARSYDALDGDNFKISQYFDSDPD